MISQRLIGIAGPAGSGKTTIAKFVAYRLIGSVVVPFSTPIKQMLFSLGVPQRNLYGTQDQKNAPLDELCGKSAREALQTLGTEWGRQHLGEDVWIRAWMRECQRRDARYVLSDDTRFQNEVEAIQATKGLVFELIGRGEYGSGHASESGEITPDYRIDNSGTPEDTSQQILSIIWREQ